MNKESFLAIIKRKWKIPYSETVSKTVSSFSLTEKVIFYALIAIFALSSFTMLWRVNESFLVKIPTYGGQFTEGIVGSPRFVNPVLAVSDIDRDLTSLIYSGLIKIDVEGNLVPDLAQSYEISEDGKIYTFILKDEIYFHDGKPVTVDDIIFTIEKTKDPIIKSPRRTSWESVEINKIDEKTIQFILRQAYSPFIQNATIGILPKHIWEGASSEEFPFSQFNINPIGSGPYKIDSTIYSSGGLPKEYRLVSFKDYASGRPFINKINIKAFTNEIDLIEAYNKGDIASLYGISPQKLSEIKIPEGSLKTTPLSRVFGIFFNQNSAPALLRPEVREALNIATNKTEIINSVLNGYGTEINNPIPPKEKDEQYTFSEENIEKAKELLSKGGWTEDENGILERTSGGDTTKLVFSISTSASPDLKLAAQLIQSQWQKIGVLVDIKIFEPTDLTQNIIKPRKYDALLFGTIIGKDMDLYPFWHSSQRNDPGLNISMYTNSRVDRILENIRVTVREEEKEALYNQFTEEITKENPAIFIYTPYFIYLTPKDVSNIKLSQLTTPSERFNQIDKWYIETNSVWKIFAQ